MAAQISLDIRHDLVLPPAGPHRLTEHCIGIVRHLRRTAERRNLCRQLVQKEPVKQCGRILQDKATGIVREPARQEPARGGSKATIGGAIEPGGDRAGDIGGEIDFILWRLAFGAFGFGGAVEEKLDRAVGRHDHDPVTLEDAEIGGIAQVIALPGVAVENDVLDPCIRHGAEQTSLPLARQHIALLRPHPRGCRRR